MPTCESNACFQTRASALALALAAALPAHAQSTTGALAETVVTATRTPTRADQLLSDVVVIEREQIEQLNDRTLPEILARTAGVQMTANGGSGKNSGVFIRGTDPRHTILLIDGVRYGSATAGTPIWDNIPVDMIERIEVVKGPASALYGSDGVGGVVQVFMRKAKPGEPAFQPRASVTVGSDSYAQGSAGFSGAADAFTYSLDVQKTRDKGFSSSNQKVPFGNFNPDRDPYYQDAANLSLGFQINPDWKIDGGVLYSAGENHFDDGPGRDTWSKLRTETGYVGVRGKVMSNWTTQLRASRATDKSNAVVATPFNLPGVFETTQDQYTWQNDIATPIGTVVAGLESLHQNVNSSTAYTVDSRTINSGFVGLNGNAGAHSWQVNLRRDDNSQFGGENTWFAGYGYRITQNWRVNGSYGTSFVAPSFNQLYFPGFSNPALQPEEGKNAELGVQWTEGAHSVKLVGYDNKIRGFITNTTLPQNIPRARIQGATLSYDGTVDALGLHASYDYLDPRNEITDKLLPRRAQNQANLGIDYTVGSWKMGATALYVGTRYDDVANSANRKLDAYTTIDLFAEYKITPAWAVQARVANLTDETYETAYGYNQRGLAGYLTVKWAPR